MEDLKYNCSYKLDGIIENIIKIKILNNNLLIKILPEHSNLF